MELLEHSLDLVGRDAPTGIGDRHQHLVGAAGNHNRNGTTIGETGGVGEQVENNLANTQSVKAHRRKIRVHGHVQPKALCVDVVGNNFHGIPNDVSEID